VIGLGAVFFGVSGSSLAFVAFLVLPDGGVLGVAALARFGDVFGAARFPIPTTADATRPWA